MVVEEETVMKKKKEKKRISYIELELLDKREYNLLLYINSYYSLYVMEIRKLMENNKTRNKRW